MSMSSYLLLLLHFMFQVQPVQMIYFNRPVNMKTREHGSKGSRKLKMAPVRLEDGSHFGSLTFQAKKKYSALYTHTCTRRLCRTHVENSRIVNSSGTYVYYAIVKY